MAWDISMIPFLVAMPNSVMKPVIKATERNSTGGVHAEHSPDQRARQIEHDDQGLAGRAKGRCANQQNAHDNGVCSEHRVAAMLPPRFRIARRTQGAPGRYVAIIGIGIVGSHYGLRRPKSKSKRGQAALPIRPIPGQLHESTSIRAMSDDVISMRCLFIRPLRHRRPKVLSARVCKRAIRESMRRPARFASARSRSSKLALYHSLGRLPEPESTHEVF